MLIDFTVYGKPEPAGSKKAFPIKGRCVVVDANPKAKPWQAEVRAAAVEAMRKQHAKAADLYGGMEGPLVMELRFGMPKPKTLKRPYPSVRPDLTKLIRAVEDAMTGIVYRDDAQIVRQVASKVYADTPFVRVLINDFEGEA